MSCVAFRKIHKKYRNIINHFSKSSDHVRFVFADFMFQRRPIDGVKTTEPKGTVLNIKLESKTYLLGRQKPTQNCCCPCTQVHWG